MDLGKYLPSAQFVLLSSSILLAGGSIYAANLYVTKQNPPAQIVATTGDDVTQEDWETTLAEIQAENADILLPAPPDAATIQKMLQAAQSSNLTESVGRTLFVNLSNAKAQGFGDDIPTQDKLVTEAINQLKLSSKTTAYTKADLRVVESTEKNLHAYGNEVIRILNSHLGADVQKTYLLISQSEDTKGSSLLGLSAIQKEYIALAKDLGDMSVPQTVLPIHLQIVNDFFIIASAYPNMQTFLSDPLRGAAGLQMYKQTLDEEQRLFTQIAQQLKKGGILFNKDEPGIVWSTVFLQ